MSENNKKFCNDCLSPAKQAHCAAWLAWFTRRTVPNFPVPVWVDTLIEHALIRTLLFFRFVSLQEDFSETTIQSRSAVVVEALKRRGVRVRAFVSKRFGVSDQFIATVHGNNIVFEGMPTRTPGEYTRPQDVHHKGKTKKRMERAGFPVVEGHMFWWWQKKKIQDYAHAIGYPVVVKPAEGTDSRHVTTGIKSDEALGTAVRNAGTYGPRVLVERYLAETFVYRATIIAQQKVFCVRQEPAHVVGDGAATITELITQKNKDPRRAPLKDKKWFPLYPILCNATTDALLRASEKNGNSVPKYNERVLLQRDPFARLGGDIIEVTGDVHPENKKLFLSLAALFHLQVVGIDFLCHDITKPWHAQESAVLECNNLPCIDFHHFPSAGTPQDVGAAVAELLLS